MKRIRLSKIKYPLMDIHFNVPMLDANFLETSSVNIVDINTKINSC